MFVDPLDGGPRDDAPGEIQRSTIPAEHCRTDNAP